MYLFQAGNSDAYVGTQYEYSVLLKKDPSLVPVMLFDRSNGGDIVMSNESIAELQNSKDGIDAYLEMDSINNTLLQDFIKRYKLQDKSINYINRDQAYISTLNAGDIKKSTIIVTYIPYDSELQKQGFKNIASTKDNLDLLVIDALFTTEKIFNTHHKQLIALKKLVDDAILVLENNPHEFYETVKPYMLELSYDEFVHSLEDIIWLNKNISAELKIRMKEAYFPTRGLI
jgi:NitT/TauT family transport system substrate-binding protein